MKTQVERGKRRKRRKSQKARTQSAAAIKPQLQPWPPGMEPPAVRTRHAEHLLGCGKTKLFELIRTGEVESYVDGGLRMVVTASIHTRRQRLLEASRAA